MPRDSNHISPTTLLSGFADLGNLLPNRLCGAEMSSSIPKERRGKDD